MSVRRRSIYVKGLSHANPIPVASVVDGLLCSGRIFGVDASSGELPQDLEAQVAHLFSNVREVMTAAGGSLQDIAKMTVSLADPADRDALNHEWVQAFPDENSRPARHVEQGTLPGGRRIACEIVAVLENAR